MALRRKIAAIISMTLLASHTAFAANSFIVKNIQVEGLSGLSPQTVMSYLPIKIGQSFDMSETSNIIASLYQTGFFSNVSLSRDGNTLIVNVNERPVIAKVNISGNSAVSTDQITTVMKEMGLQQGQVLDQSVLDQVSKSLQSAYDSQGHYNATVTAIVTPVARNRVNVNIVISEGRVALVEKIRIIGNHAYSEKKLIRTLTLTTPKWDSIITRADHYTKDALDNSLQTLGNFYMDHGYIHFKVNSANAVLTPDRKSIYLIININEGSQYRLAGYNFTGNTILPTTQFTATPMFKALTAGKVFSRQNTMDASKAISILLGNQGYAFADVNIEPTIDEIHKTVFITFHVNPGNRVYVHRVNFAGNTSTSDNVLRTATRQMEGALFSSSAIDESTRQINLLGYFTNVKEDTEPVAGSQNQVDVNYNVSEQPSAQATAGAGYGTDGFVVSAGVNENDFMGTGKQVGVNFSQNIYQRSYSASYNNPYFTPDGVQRGFNIFYTQTDPGALNLAPYSFTSYGANMVYTIPFSPVDDYQLGIGLQRTSLSLGSGGSSIQIQQFVQNEGSAFNQLMLTLGWTRNGFDRAYFPTRGILQTAGLQVSAPLAGRPLDFYKLSYQIHGYQPLPEGFIGSVVGSFGYGGAYGSTKGLPFFTNYYAGGMAVQGQVRGYETNTLGPLDSNLQPIGGNTLLSGSLQLILPGFLSSDNYRTSVFVDSGNVYNTWNVYNTYPTNQVGLQLGQLRYSAGVDFQWRLPILNAIIELSYAKALNAKPGDQLEPFSFNIGGNF
jgi:outer membrane protein insertion porin family